MTRFERSRRSRRTRWMAFAACLAIITAAGAPAMMARALVSEPDPGIVTSLDTIISDQQGTHEAVIPVPDGYSWKTGTEIQSGSDNQGMAAAVTWGALFLDGLPVDAGIDPGTGNTRVQIRDMECWVLSKSTGEWTLVTSGQEYGDAYRENFSGNVSWPMDVRDEPEGISGKLRFAWGQRGAWHFWTPRGSIDPNDVGGVFGTLQGRLVLDDPSGPDDRDFWSTRLLLGTGVDYWRDLTAAWPDNAGASIGRFKYVTQDWRAYTTTTLTPEQLRANPPPIELRAANAAASSYRR